MIELRKAVCADAACIAYTRQKAWAATYRGIYPDSEIDDFDFERHIRLERKRLENPDYCCYLVMDAENTVGYVSYGPTKDGFFRLHSLYLLPEARKKGLGGRIFRSVREACLAMGYAKMHLDCNSHNQNALNFYQHMGGQLIDIDAGHENPQEDSCVLEFSFT